MEAMSVINLMPSKKAEVGTFVSKLINEVNSGTINPLQLRVQIKAIEVALGEVSKATADLQLTEAQKYGARSFEFAGAKVEISELATRYEYDQCGDIELIELQNKFDEAEEKLKERKRFLQMLSKPMTITSHETGETYDVTPAQKKSTTGLKITLI